VVVERVLVGAFMTALDMAGWSLSLLVLDDLRLCRLDAPTRARPHPSLVRSAPMLLLALLGLYLHAAWLAA